MQKQKAGKEYTMHSKGKNLKNSKLGIASKLQILTQKICLQKYQPKTIKMQYYFE